MTNTFKIISLSYKTTPLMVRERMALNESSSKKLIVTLQQFCEISDLLILSTCNRTEIYYSSTTDYGREILILLGLQQGINHIEEYFPFFKRIDSHQEAILHLFYVSMGLDSQVMGDLQISGQVKQAYQWSAALSAAGPFLHRLMHTIFYTHKNIVRSTSFRDGVTSTSYAAVELAETLCTTLQEPKVLIIGAGEIGSDVCHHFCKKKFRNITLVNRTSEKAEALAKSLPLRIIPFSNLWTAIEEADIIVSCISMPQTLITKEKTKHLTLHSYKYFIDLSVPRSIEQTLEEREGLIVYNIDDIKTKTDEALEKRMQAIPQVKQLIAESIKDFNNWEKEAMVSPVIQQLKKALEEIRNRELSRHIKNLTPSETEKIDLITRNMIQKIINLPVLQLKAACQRGNSEMLVDVLNGLFDLKAFPNKYE